MAGSINKNERVKGLGDETWSLEQVKDFKKEERLIPTFAKGVKVFLITLNILYCIVRIEDLLLFVQLHATFKFILLQAFGFTLGITPFGDDWNFDQDNMFIHCIKDTFGVGYNNGFSKLGLDQGN